MGLQKLIESSKKFKFDEVYWYDGGEIARQSFLEKFPLNSLKDLSLDQYVQGTDKESFCYWLEFKKILFGIGGGNASKFGLYKAKDGNYYAGYGKNKRTIVWRRA